MPAPPSVIISEMFGYIRPWVPSLRVAEFEFYRAVYCTVCREMGRLCGASSRFALSYDSVFLALLRMAAAGESPEAVRHPCPVNPLAGKTMLAGSDAIRYSAEVCAVLAADKLADDAEDEKGFRRAAAGTACGIGKKWIRRSEKRTEGLAGGISSRLSGYDEAEKNASAPSAVEPLMEAFGEVLSFCASFGLEGERAIVTAAVGRHVGRWICAIDALDDMEKDRKSGNINPFLTLYPEAQLSADDKVTLSCLLNGEAAAAADALDLLTHDGNREPWSILENILREGMPHVTRAVLDHSYKKPRRGRIREREEAYPSMRNSEGEKENG